MKKVEAELRGPPSEDAQGNDLQQESATMANGVVRHGVKFDQSYSPKTPPFPSCLLLTCFQPNLNSPLRLSVKTDSSLKFILCSS